MGQILKDIPFEAWVAHLFDHEVRSPQWYFDLESDYWDGSSEVTIAYITRLFEEPIIPLSGYSEEQLNQGFWYLVSNSGSNHMFALLDEKAPLENRERCVRSIFPLFEKLFATWCSPFLSHLDEPGLNPLNSACYMWWDIISIHGKPKDNSRHPIDHTILSVMKRILNLDSAACQESALHGLGHWQMYYPTDVHAIIDNYLANPGNIRTELLKYAQQARRGMVL